MNSVTQWRVRAQGDRIRIVATVAMLMALAGAVLVPATRAEAADATPLAMTLSESSYTGGRYFTAKINTTDTLRNTVGHNNATLRLQLLREDAAGAITTVDLVSSTTADKLSTFLMRTGSAGAYVHTFVVSNYESYHSTYGQTLRIYDSSNSKVIAESRWYSYRIPVSVNQIGYRPTQKKTAYIVTPQPILTYDGATDYAAANRWNIHIYKPVTGGRVSVWDREYTDAQLLTALKSTGSVDQATMRYVYEIDFSDLTEEASGLYFGISNTNGSSLPFNSSKFSIGNQVLSDTYREMSRDALRYFYFHRMGTATEASYLAPGENYTSTADQNTAAAKHAHAAFSGFAVPCFKGLACEAGTTTIPATNGWADAGDFGLYPVNTAAAAWQLMNIVEFDENNSTKVNPNLPSIANQNVGVNESSTPSAIMREVLYGINYMYAVDPAKVKNMPHKIHNQAWSDANGWTPDDELDVAPATDSDEDYSQRSATVGSTAASYAACRVLAQASRIMFMNSAANQVAGVSQLRTDYLNKANAWYQEAKNTPVSLYPSTYAAAAQNTFSIGGGPYGDKDISDDQYACLVELYLANYARSATDATTTGLRDAVKNHAKFADNNVRYDVDYWSNPTTLANLSLLTTANHFWSLDGGVKMNMIIGSLGTASTSIKTKVIGSTTAAEYPAVRGNESWPWASNVEALNAVMLLNYWIKFGASANQKIDAANTAYEILGYVLGANAQNKSFVTGYGDNAETDTHDRLAWWANRTAGTKYPAGWLSGGPMTDIASCMSGGEVNYSGGPSYERATPFWQGTATGASDGAEDDTPNKRLTDKLLSSHEAYGAKFRVNGSDKSGQDLTKLLSQAVTKSDPYPGFSILGAPAPGKVPPALAYAKNYTAPWGWCSKENAVNYNASLVWTAAAAYDYMSDGLQP